MFLSNAEGPPETVSGGPSAGVQSCLMNFGRMMVV